MDSGNIKFMRPPLPGDKFQHIVFPNPDDSLIISDKSIASKSRSRVEREDSVRAGFDAFPSLVPSEIPDEDTRSNLVALAFYLEPSITLNHMGKVEIANLTPSNHPYVLLCDLFSRIMAERNKQGPILPIRLGMMKGEIDFTHGTILCYAVGMARAIRWARRLGGDFEEEANLYLFEYIPHCLKYSSDNQKAVFDNILESFIENVGKYPSLLVTEWNRYASKALPLLMVNMMSRCGSVVPDAMSIQAVLQTLHKEIEEELKHSIAPEVDFDKEMKARYKRMLPEFITRTFSEKIPGNPNFSENEIEDYVKSLSCFWAIISMDSGDPACSQGDDHGDYDREAAKPSPVEVAEAADSSFDVPLEHMAIVDLPGMRLNPKKRKSRITRYLSEGTRINTRRLAVCSLTDSTGNLFYYRRFSKDIRGGTVIIDASGSMGLTTDHIIQLIKAAPGATIAYYSSGDHRSGTSRSSYAIHGTMFVAAREGKVSYLVDKPRGIPTGGGGNAVDYQALRWMLNHPEPWYYVTDEAFTGGHTNQAPSCARLIRLLKARKMITVYNSLGEAMERFSKIGSNP